MSTAASRDLPVATARTIEEARQKRFELEQRMADLGLFPKLLIGPVRAAARDDAEKVGIYYDAGDDSGNAS